MWAADSSTPMQAGMEAFARGDLPAAKIAFETLLRANPDDVVALVNLGGVEYRLKHFAEAEKALKKAVRLQPETGAAWLSLGAAYCDEDRLDEALAALAQAVLLEPKSARAHNYLGVTIGKKKWFSGAEMELQRALELDSNYADAHFNLALLYLRRSPRAIELARRHYQKAVELGAARDGLIEKDLAAPDE